MNKLLLSIFTATIIFASESMMPPMPPSVGGEKKTESSMPKECAEVPPMIIFLPPPLEEAYYQCKNALHLPKKDDAKSKIDKLLGENIEVESIKIATGFSEVYMIDVINKKKKKTTLMCNKNIDRCVENPKILR